MKQLVILSGKGGSGKTSVSGALAALIAKDHSIHAPIFVDADVDASNLELLLQPQKTQSEAFSGGEIAHIDPDICISCGKCEQSCRFEAIISTDNSFSVDPISCEGCGLCQIVCPINAITMAPQQNGYSFQSDSAYGKLFHANLFPGGENSGKLVAKIRQQAQAFAEEGHSNLILIDGPPGIGCPVISAVTGADLALIIAEPSQSGIHDMVRILETVRHFDVPTIVCINKFDIHAEGAQQIEEYCNQHTISIVGKLPFDQSITRAMVNGLPITEYLPNSNTAQLFVNIWEQIKIQAKP